MADERRLRLRRRLLVVGLLPLLLALALCVKVGVMLGFDDRGRNAFAEGQFERAGEAFAVNGWLNEFEPWISRFDEGTADYRLADYASARALLESALVVVPGEKQCLVRINLALTLEALGDAELPDGRRDQAEAYWRQGIAVLDEGSCRGTDVDARSVATRLADKLADRAPEAEEQVVEETTDRPELEELERRNQEAQEQRRKTEETREDEPPPDDGTPPSYSW